MFYRWRRLEEEDRGRVWWLYGWFTGLMACGSCVGAVAWAARMASLVNLFKARNSNHNPVQQTSLLALAYSCSSASLVTYPIEFLCMCAAKLMVLDRMMVFAAPQGAGMPKLWAATGRAVMAAVVLGNAVGLAANAAAAVHYYKAAQAEITATAAYAANNTKDGDNHWSSGRQELQRGAPMLSVQRACEATVLFLIVAAFVVVGVLSARRVSARLLGVDAASAVAATGRAIRRRMLGTTAFIFVTFLMRCVYSTSFAVVIENRDFGIDCPESEHILTYCASCYNTYTHISGYWTFTPALETAVTLISSPVALLVALWGMTSNATLQLMKSSGQESAMSLRLIKRSTEKATMPQGVLGE
jgi:hypothetical protein